MSDDVLSEIPERAATGEIADIYAALRSTLGVPMVNLVFRHMATVPGCLRWVWDCLEPLYSGDALHAAGLALVGDNLPASGPGASATVRDTLNSYIRANPINMMGLFLLERVLDAGGPVAGDGPGHPPVISPLTQMIPMADLSALPSEIVARLRALARMLHGADGPVIPSVFRHFATDPAALKVIERVLIDMTTTGRLAEAAAKMIAGGHAAAARLAVRPLRPAEPTTAAAIRHLAALFPSNMAKMTIVAMTLRRQLR